MCPETGNPAATQANAALRDGLLNQRPRRPRPTLRYATACYVAISNQLPEEGDPAATQTNPELRDGGPCDPRQSCATRQLATPEVESAARGSSDPAETQTNSALRPRPILRYASKAQRRAAGGGHSIVDDDAQRGEEGPRSARARALSPSLCLSLSLCSGSILRLAAPARCSGSLLRLAAPAGCFG